MFKPQNPAKQIVVVFRKQLPKKHRQAEVESAAGEGGASNNNTSSREREMVVLTTLTTCKQVE
jgi:hypothetical protein